MIHFVYRKEAGDAGQPVDAEACWRQMLTYMARWSQSTATLFAAEATIEVDVPRKMITLVARPELHEALATMQVRLGLIAEAITAVFGEDYRWALVPGTWATMPEEAPAQAPQAMNPGPSAFEQRKQVSPDGAEFWSSRELAGVLGYRRMRDFDKVMIKARSACANSGQHVDDHFAEAFAATPGFGGDLLLSRYACYLVIQNSDPQKAMVAQGQTYFAVQARRQEVADQALNTEDQRRLMLRQEMALHNKKLAAAARKAGVAAPQDFSAFQNAGYKGLYGGLNAKMIRAHRHQPTNQNILDTMGSTELAANLFRATQTEEKLRRNELRDKDEAIRTHHQVGARVRQAMQEISGVMPEDLPVVEDINTVRRRMQKQLTARESLKAL